MKLKLNLIQTHLGFFCILTDLGEHLAAVVLIIMYQNLQSSFS